MRRLLLLAGVGGVLWWALARRRRRRQEPRAVIGYADGSSVEVTASAEFDRMVATARSVIGP
jgi:hypothetical protein